MMNTSSNQQKSKTNCQVDSLTEARSSSCPHVYFYPESGEFLIVPDDSLEREHNELYSYLNSVREKQYNIEYLNHRYSHLERSLNEKQYVTELHKLKEEYSEACKKLNDNVIGELSALNDEPEGLSTIPSASKIVELIGITEETTGYKRTYVRSNIIENHWRTYNLNNADRQNDNNNFIHTVDYRDKNGNFVYDDSNNRMQTQEFNLAQLNQSLSEIEPKLKYEFFNISESGDFKDLQTPYSMNPLTKLWANPILNWAAEFNKTYNSAPPYKGKQLTIDSKSQLFRWSFGAESGVDFSAGELGGDFLPNLGLALQLQANASLVETRSQATLHRPDRYGIKICYPVTDSTELAILGTLRFDFSLTIGGNVGASMGLQSGVNLTQDTLVGIPAELGFTPRTTVPEARGFNVTERAEESGSKTVFDVFIGAKAGIGLSGEMLWKNPNATDSELEQNKEKDGFSTLAKVASDIEFMAGAGRTRTFAITYTNGRIRLLVHAGICWGVGGAGKVAFDIDAKNIMNDFMPCLGQMLKNIDYRKIPDIIEPRHFLAICCIPIFSTMNNIFSNYHDIDDIILEIKSSIANLNNRIELMEKIINSKGECFKYCPPETKGCIIDALLTYNTWDSLLDSTSNRFANFCEKDGTHNTRKSAILHVLRWAQSRRDFDNILQHLNDTPTSVKSDIAVNKKRISEFLSIDEDWKKQFGSEVKYRKPSRYNELFLQMRSLLPDVNTTHVIANQPFQEFITATQVTSCTQYTRTDI